MGTNEVFKIELSCWLQIGKGLQDLRIRGLWRNLWVQACITNNLLFFSLVPRQWKCACWSRDRQGSSLHGTLLLGSVSQPRVPDHDRFQSFSCSLGSRSLPCFRERRAKIRMTFHKHMFQQYFRGKSAWGWEMEACPCSGKETQLQPFCLLN